MSTHTDKEVPSENSTTPELSEFAQEIFEGVMDSDLDDRVRPNRGSALTDAERDEALSNFCKGYLRETLGNLLNSKKNENSDST